MAPLEGSRPYGPDPPFLGLYILKKKYKNLKRDKSKD
jgi:hypothetical protein